MTYTVKEVAEILRISEYRVREMLKETDDLRRRGESTEGRLHGFRAGRKWRIKKEDLDAYTSTA